MKIQENKEYHIQESKEYHSRYYKNLVSRRSMRLPNLVILGAPKCGTTSLFHWLNSHPEVYGIRETHYFVDKESYSLRKYKKNYNDNGLQAYLDYFKSCPKEAKIVLESTPSYLYQKTALDFFSNCQPQPNIVISIRKPSSQIFSAFSYLQNNLATAPKDITFSKFVDLLISNNLEQLSEKFYPFESSFYYLNKILEYDSYCDWLLLWKSRFRQEKMSILIFEDIINNPKSILVKIAKDNFINPNFYLNFNFSKSNETRGKEVRSWFLHQRIAPISRVIPRNSSRGIIKKIYLKLQQREVTISKPDPKAIALLDEYFIPHNKKLSELFNLDLSSWS